MLFALFVVLFAFSWQSKKGIGTVSEAIHSGFDILSSKPPDPVAKASQVSDQHVLSAPPTAEPTPFNTDKLTKQLQGVLGDSISKHEIVMRQTSDGLVISLRELGFFNSGEAKLLPGALDKLRATAEVLMAQGLELRVEGHSDDQPIHTASFQSNWELSSGRAMSVLNLLVDQAGFPAAKISVAGYGSHRPVADNGTAEGRRMNRRVDLVVIAPRGGAASVSGGIASGK